MTPERQPIVVTAAVVERDAAYLLTTRPDGTHLAGCWEFPGGKCEPGETPEQSLERELREELDVETTVGAEVFRTRYRYPDRYLELRFFSCTVSGEPRPMQGQQVQWVPRERLLALAFPPADAEFVARLCASGQRPESRTVR